MKKNEAEIEIKKLIEQFRNNESFYCSNSYYEANVRNEFINPFFEVLGWNIQNRGISNPQDREVIVENLITTTTAKKFVDYTFKINNKIQFLIEAKSPSESLDNVKHIFQAKSYAFSLGVPFVILTNFKSFKFFDISMKPIINQPRTDLVASFEMDYTDYETNFELIWNMFSKEQVENKSLINLYVSRRGNVQANQVTFNLNYANIKGSSLLDKEFLNDLLTWRKELALDIFRNNSSLSEYDINEVVQRYLDRIIFIRILEDRQIEPREILREGVWKLNNNKINNLKSYLDQEYVILDEKYNGLLFHKSDLMDNINISNDVLKSIINSTYFPNSPYNFSSIDIEILGRIFEQYLGNTITVSNGMINIELKSELKKSGGAYFTPKEIVDEIIENTVDEQLKSINTINDLINYKIIDIACGSGSFLVRAYKSIISYNEKIYSTDSSLRAKALREQIVFDDNGMVHLTMKTKKNILIHNIFGVDIDTQAIEVTKMSLYITMLEENYKDDSNRPMLPTLDDNIKRGNSIVDMDYYKGYGIFDPDEDLKIKPFNWRYNFSNIIKTGGFDCVIGNPPYIRIQMLEQVYPTNIVDYIKDKSRVATYGNFDLSIVFIERALSLIKPAGILGFIVLSKFFTTKYGELLRELLSNSKVLYKIVDFKDQQVFPEAITYTCLLYLKNMVNDQFKYSKVDDIEQWKLHRNLRYENMDIGDFNKEPWYFGDNIYKQIEQKISTDSITLYDIADKVFVGVQTNCDDVFLLEVEREDVENNIIYCKSNYTNQVHPFELNHLKKVVKGSADIKKYKHSDKKRLIFPYKLGKSRPPVIDESEYRSNYPLTWKYLNQCKSRLSSRSEVVNGECCWYEYRYRKNHSRFEQEKILLPSLCNGSRFSLDVPGEYYFTGSGQAGGGGYAITLKSSSTYDYYSLLGILNSIVISFFIVHNGTPQSGGYQGIRKEFIENLILPKINSKTMETIRDEIAHNVRLLLHVINTASSNSQTLSRKKQLLDYYTSIIDELTCRLYGINDDDMKFMLNFVE